MKIPLALTVLIALAGCSEPAEPPIASTADSPPAPVAPTPEPGAPPAEYASSAPSDVEAPPSQTTPGPVPLEFRHVWAIKVADCTAEPGLTRIAIAPAAVKFYEGRSEVVSVEESGPKGVIMQVSHVAEGQKENQVHTLKLDDAGTTLTYERGGSTFTYTRCDQK